MGVCLLSKGPRWLYKGLERQSFKGLIAFFGPDPSGLRINVVTVDFEPSQFSHRNNFL